MAENQTFLLGIDSLIIQFNTPLTNYYPIAKKAEGKQWELNALNVILRIPIQSIFVVNAEPN